VCTGGVGYENEFECQLTTPTVSGQGQQQQEEEGRKSARET